MYNRYIPQPDGSYRRSRLPETPPPVPHTAQEQHPVHKPEPPCSDSSAPPIVHPRKKANPAPPSYYRRPVLPKKDTGSVSGFFKQLIPKDFDTGDLLVVILLLLMAGDSSEDQNTALLTLALYLLL